MKARTTSVIGAVALACVGSAAATQARTDALPGVIAFSSDRDGNAEIYVMAETGRAVRRLTRSHTFDGFPHWSPDGRRILFYSQRTPNGDLFVMNANGSSPRNLTRNRRS